MPRQSKSVECVDCGRVYPRKELNRHFRCNDCAMKAMRDTPYQLHIHSGPAYEKWLESMKERIGRL